MIIGVSGKLNSGKDLVGQIILWLLAKDLYDSKFTLSEYLEEHRTDKLCNWEIKKYAYKVKQIASIITGIPIEKFEDREFKKTTLDENWYISEKAKNGVYYNKGMTVRTMLQKIGTDCLRDNLHPNVWINALFADYTDVLNWIITDVRFPNEARAIKARGGVVIRLLRGSDSELTHESETALDSYKDWDYTVDNRNLSKGELAVKVESILKDLKII